MMGCNVYSILFQLWVPQPMGVHWCMNIHKAKTTQQVSNVHHPYNLFTQTPNSTALAVLYGSSAKTQRRKLEVKHWNDENNSTSFKSNPKNQQDFPAFITWKCYLVQGAVSRITQTSVWSNHPCLTVSIWTVKCDPLGLLFWSVILQVLVPLIT